MSHVFKYKNFILDNFQKEAINSIEKNHSVIVSAATGTGKTLIADYVIDKYLKEKRKIIYTAPIKALSNQKYKEFRDDYGKENVGMLTGDVTINKDAQIMIMTTEIYRNMLLTKDKSLDTISYVVFDEIHYINDIERGTVWEESIIFSPDHVRFLCLSATIPNAKQFSQWIESIKDHKVDIVKNAVRAVPLKHFLFDINEGIIELSKLKKVLEKDKYSDYYNVTGRKKKIRVKAPSHLDLIKILNKNYHLPAFYFVFNRKKCEELAEELYNKFDFTTKEEKKLIIDYYYKNLTKETREMKSSKKIKKLLTHGIGVHHAGLLPKIKEVVEELFSKNVIKVLYTTETFAVGINMPAKTVCFNSLEKYDGVSFRYLNSKEYFQLAGRAGRRGIDKEGRSIALINRNHADLDKIEKFTSADTQPIISQFKLSYNTVLNLVNNHTPREREIILKSNFDYFLRKQESKKRVLVMLSFKKKYLKLDKMGYIEDDYLTQKGFFASYIYSDELLITEIFTSDLYKKLNEKQLLILLASIRYEERLNDKFKKGDKKNYFKIIDTLKRYPFIEKNINKNNISNLNKIVSFWASDGKFQELLEFTTCTEGDIIRIFRQVVDLIKQVLRAGEDDFDLTEKLQKCLKLIHRDVIKVEF